MSYTTGPLSERQLAKTTKSGRIYQWKSDHFVSVTTALDVLPKPALNSWKLRMVAQTAAKNRADIAQIGDEKEAQKKILDLYYSTPMNERALLGSRIHKFAEWISKSEEFPEQPTEIEQPFVDAYREFVRDWSPVLVESEATVFSRKHGYAGSLDAIYNIRGANYVVDIKTGKSVWEEVALQCAAYRFAEFIARPATDTEDPLPETKGAMVLHLTPTGYILYPLDSGPTTFETFLSAVDIWRWQNLEKEGVIRPPLDWREE